MLECVYVCMCLCVCASEGRWVAGVEGKDGILGRQHCITMFNYHPDSEP